MSKFFETYKADIIYSAIVIGAVIVLYILTQVLHRWLRKKVREKLPGASTRPLNLIRRILNLLWLVLGAITIGLLFVNNGQESSLQEYFKLFSYLGIVAVITIIAVTIANMWFKHKINGIIASDHDPTSYKFLRYVVVATIGFVGVVFGLMAFPGLKGVAQTALGGAGVLALIAGLAAQEALSNVIGGLFIISFRPFQIGHLIKVTDSMTGTVTDITLRHTIIRNFENKRIVIPNSVINKEKLINYDLDELKCCERIEIGISYDSDIDLAKKIMREECENHPLILDNRSEEDKMEGKPVVRTALIALGDSSMTIRAWTWGKNFSDSFQLKIDVLESIKKRFDKEGIEIPFPYRTIVMKNPNGKEMGKTSEEN